VADEPPVTLSVTPLVGIEEVHEGDDLAALIVAALDANEIALQHDDVVVVTHKVVSKAEGSVEPFDSEQEYRDIVERESRAVIRRRGDLTISITRQGFICANAGVDRSNVEPGHAVLHPRNPDSSAHELRKRIERETGVRLAVVITDTFGRVWRRGLTDVAIGVSGMAPLLDYRGSVDTWNRRLEVTEVAIVDEIAAAADLVMGKADNIPVAIVRGLSWMPGEGRATDLVRPPHEDLFR
jgi:coenzyme F420-0:L-glutamate ligase/coenzyme F420-1:gamma-L-glutamate ligase